MDHPLVFAGISLNGALFLFSSDHHTMSDSGERGTPADPDKATAAAAAAGVGAGATAASPVLSETLGGVDVKLLDSLERAAGAGDAQATADLIMSRNNIVSPTSLLQTNRSDRFAAPFSTGLHSVATRQ